MGEEELQLNFIVASELSITGASQIGQTSATNLSGVVLAHVSKHCRDLNNRDENCVQTGQNTWKHGKGVKNRDCYKGHWHHEGGGRSCCGTFSFGRC